MSTVAKGTKQKSDTATDTLAEKSRSADVISGGHLVARALKNEGVDTIFTLCGGHIIDIYDGCIDEGIKVVDVRHEQAAVHAADAWARCNPGRIGVAAIHRPSGNTVGRSFSEWTARWTRPLRSASSSSRVKTPLPLISWRGW